MSLSLKTKYVIGGVFVVAFFATSFGLVTQALFTDTASVGGNAFAAGTVDITASPASALLTATNWAPGDEKTGRLRSTTAARCHSATLSKSAGQIPTPWTFARC